MRILIDESIPRRFKGELVGHAVATVVECGWAGTRNGELLALAARNFDVFITCDQNLEFQQNLLTLPIAVIVLAAEDNRLPTLQTLVPALQGELARVKPCELVRLQK